jgi:steroid delta-isomerase
MEAVSAHDRDTWLSLFAADATLHDPVGGSPLDPEGRGISGRPALESFWDLTVAPNEIAFEIRESHPAGPTAALLATVSITTATGTEISYDGVFAYELDDAGKVAILRAYWDLEPVLAALV